MNPKLPSLTRAYPFLWLSSNGDRRGVIHDQDSFPSLTDAVTIFSASNTLPSHLGQQSWEEGNLIQIWFNRIILIFQTVLKHKRYMVSNLACSPFSALMTQVSTVERASMSSAEFMNILGTEVERMLREIHSVWFIWDSPQ